MSHNWTYKYERLLDIKGCWFKIIYKLLNHPYLQPKILFECIHCVIHSAPRLYTSRNSLVSIVSILRVNWECVSLLEETRVQRVILEGCKSHSKSCKRKSSVLSTIVEPSSRVLKKRSGRRRELPNHYKRVCISYLSLLHFHCMPIYWIVYLYCMLVY